jgi:RNA 2',3'-cyclic 3'-phosphodiesterase
MVPAAPVGRLFLAAPLPPDLRRALSDHLDRGLDGRRLPGRVVAAESWHLTLKFLGDTRADTYARLRAALGAADLGPAFALAFTSLGSFPAPARARVLWLGTGAGAGELAALAARVEAAAVSAGFAPEDRPFAAHLTLSRIRPDADVRSLLAAVPPFDTRMTVDRVVLFRSHLGRDGARYEALARYDLH